MPLLSICIPVYNQDINSLIKGLVNELQHSTIDGNIVILDDGSSEEFRKSNRALGNLSEVLYEELPHNIGRSAIRNKLAHKAEGKYLLFLDDDSQLFSSQLLKTYVEEARPGCVICGGRVYQKEEPTAEYRLHWKYGSLKESLKAEKRRANPHVFHSNNFLIDRKLFLGIQFDESLKQYGHEDTLFAYELSKKGISAMHIENPVRHDGLETSQDFLHKTRLGIQNLARLYKNQPVDFSNYVRLLKSYEKVKKNGLNRLLALFYKLSKENWEARLGSENPSLKLFNLYKLAYLCRLMLKGSESP